MVGVAASEAVGGKNANDVDLAIAHGVAQCIQTRAVETGPTVAFVTEDMGLIQVVSCVVGPGAQGVELAVDGLLALLALGRDAGVDGGAHGGSPSVMGTGSSKLR